MSTLSITIVQTDIAWEDKKTNLARLDKKLSALREKTELVILPEMFSTGFSMDPEQQAETMEGPTVNWMKQVAASGKFILTGSLIIEEEGNYFNRLVWMLPNGQCGVYDKRHLFTFGGEERHYTAGRSRLIASVKGWKVNLQVCYDLRFPVWSRQTRVSEGLEYDLLIYVANWPQRRNTAWKTLLRARAIENQCFVAGVNRIGNDGEQIYHSGDSMIVDPLGSVLYEKEGTEDLFTCILDKNILAENRGKFPFWRDADQFFIQS